MERVNIMKKTIVALLDIELEKIVPEEALNDYICTEFGWLADSGIILRNFSDVPNDTTIKEIQDAVVSKRSEQIEEEFHEDLQELA